MVLETQLVARAARPPPQVDIVREAITRGGIDVNETDYEKRSCLHIAAGAGQLAVVELLLQHKAP